VLKVTLEIVNFTVSPLWTRNERVGNHHAVDFFVIRHHGHPFSLNAFSVRKAGNFCSINQIRLGVNEMSYWNSAGNGLLQNEIVIAFDLFLAFQNIGNAGFSGWRIAAYP